MPAATRWDIFCRVVDNYGDVGVCWRLARQLAAEHALEATLWLDDLAPLARIAPGVDRELALQHSEGVTVRRWNEPFADTKVADVAIEAFGCGLPDRYVAAMLQRSVAPTWFVLEYLSAEAWVDRSHGLASPHPRLPLTRRFWFPGFTSRTGGLLRERGLLDARDRFVDDSGAQRDFWARLNVPPIADGEIRASLFSYANPGLPGLFDAWAAGDAPITCIVPDGVAAAELVEWTAGNVPHAGTPFTRGALDDPRDSLPAAGRLRPAAVGVRRQLRSRRGFVRPRAVGGASLRLAHLSPGRERALGESSTPFSTCTPPRSTARRLPACAGSGTAGTVCLAPPASGAAWHGFVCARGALATSCGCLVGPARANCPISRQGWSRPPPMGYN